MGTAANGQTSVFSIRAFGAAGNGQAKDTAAIQAAIDACARAGGGRVLCPPGTYLTGSIELKDNVDLHIEAGATLLGSADRADYRRRLPEEHWNVSEMLNCDQHLIFADNRRRVGVSGRGVIDGRCEAFMTPNRKKPEKGLRVLEWRPGQCVHFKGCEDVAVRDITILNSPSWTVWLLCCRRVRIGGISIHNIRNSANTDGIDICCCHDVTVSDCIIDAGDDCIAVYDSDLTDKRRKEVCENITVTNCVLSTRCCGVRIGYSSDGTIRNAAFSNLVMPDVGIGVDMIPNRFQDGPDAQLQHGPRIENIRFQNLVIHATRTAVHFWIDENNLPPSGIRNVALANVTARARAGCHIGGTPRIPIENIRITDMQLTLTGEADPRYAGGVPYPVSCWASASPMPHGLYTRFARNVHLHDVRIDWEQAAGPWQSAVRAEHVTGLDIDGLQARQGPESDAAVVHATNVRNLSLRNSCAAEGTGVFLAVDGPETADVRMIGNDLAHAREPLRVGPDAPPGCVRAAPVPTA